MDIERFVNERQPEWERLDALLLRVSKGLGRLDRSDLRDLGILYRQTASDLARLQGAGAEVDLTEHLTDLMVRGHGIIYRAEPARLRHAWRFLSQEFPRLVRQEWQPLLAAVLLFGIPALWCVLMAALDPQFADAVAPPGLRERLEKGELWVYRINPIKPVASSAIMTNNISVTFTFFALGITFGLGTAAGLVSNGLHLGTIALVVGQTRMAPEFWGFVAPHGALEIPAIFIGGAAGLILGAALLFPGDARRKDALVARGRVAVKLVLGCVPILIVAGLIEGFVSPLPPGTLPPGIKFLLGGSLFVLLLVYLLAGGKGDQGNAKGRASFSAGAASPREQD